MKNLKKLKNYELFKIDTNTSIESWSDYIIVKNREEAELAAKLLNKNPAELESVSWSMLDSIYIFEDDNE